MALISGIFLPKEKRVEIGLTYIYGIGLKTAKDMLNDTGVNPDTRIKDLKHEEIAALQKKISNDVLFNTG